MDKHRASVKHLYSTSVDALHEDYIKPQENGSHFNCNYLNLTGLCGGLEVTGEGFLARALCHEIDHLDGVVYVDRMIEDVSDRYQQVKGDDRG